MVYSQPIVYLYRWVKSLAPAWNLHAMQIHVDAGLEKHSVDEKSFSPTPFFHVNHQIRHENICHHPLLFIYNIFYFKSHVMLRLIIRNSHHWLVSIEPCTYNSIGTPTQSQLPNWIYFVYRVDQSRIIASSCRRCTTENEHYSIVVVVVCVDVGRNILPW